ncbi:hypothetical protein [Rhodococcus sp. NPDC006774]|uniref:hypothetical protein n=1 Tax=Rhodococcus sp. NPDC006774 TaxID=3157186 RepID=UPI0033C2023D
MGIPDDPEALLDDAHASLLEAASHPAHSIRARCSFHHAATQASDVLLRPESTATQRDHATRYLHQALAAGPYQDTTSGGHT